MFQDAKVMSEHKVDIKASTIIGTRQNTQAKIVKQVSSWRPVTVTWARLKQSRAAAAPTDRSEQSKRAALTTSTVATTKTVRNTSDEFS